MSEEVSCVGDGLRKWSPGNISHAYILNSDSFYLMLSVELGSRPCVLLSQHSTFGSPRVSDDECKGRTKKSQLIDFQNVVLRLSPMFSKFLSCSLKFSVVLCVFLAHVHKKKRPKPECKSSFGRLSCWSAASICGNIWRKSYSRIHFVLWAFPCAPVRCRQS